MTKDIDIKTFQAKLNKDRSHNPVTEYEAAEAYRNLGEFILLLYKINQREGIVSMEELEGTTGQLPQNEPAKPNESNLASTPS
jgi:hypothetical protein